MRCERIVVVLLLLPTIFWVVASGGWLYTLGVAFILGMAAAEYGRLFHPSGLRPAVVLMAGGSASVAVLQGTFAELLPQALTLIILIAMVWHLVDYERGAETSGSDFGITLSGIVYTGWIGSHLISLRALEDGLWWLLLVMSATWLADSAAYFVGSRWGRRHLAPRLSPNKTWEGYIAGVLTGTVVGGLFGLLWGIGAGSGSVVSVNSGLLVGFFVSLLSTFGDLGVSMFKRQLHVKDTGQLLPGHGGALDRIDTWIWAAVIGQAMIQLVGKL